LIAKRKKELANEHTKLQAKAQRIAQELATATITPKWEEELMAHLCFIAEQH
jgi:hypothetical protein